MVWWYYAIYYAAVLILGDVLRPKVSVQDAVAVKAEDAEMPVVSSIKSVPVIWGRIRMREPNLTWYGDYYAAPVRKRAGKGGFLGTGKTIWQTVGYRYYWGQQLALCHGPATLHRVWSEEREIWSGNNAGGAIVIDSEALYGGEDSGGGVAAVCAFIPGNQIQEEDYYLKKMLTTVPAYRGVASFVWYGPSTNMSAARTVFGMSYVGSKQSGYIGTSPIPRRMSFELSRYPNALIPAKAKIGDDSNPAEILYECLTTDPNGVDGWGMGLSDALIDRAAFIASAEKLYDEGFGISMQWSSQSPIVDVIADICKTIDAVCYRDFRTGLYTLKLIRGGYNVRSLPVLDESNILEMENFSQAGLDGTTNDVVVNYTDRSQNYKKLSARAQDFANMRTQSDVVAAALNFTSIQTAALADRIANRELFAGSSPIAKADVIVNRQAYAYGPGDLFVVKWADLGIDGLVMRVQRASIGGPKANRIRLSLVQDVFTLGVASLAAPGGTSWTDPIIDPTSVDTQAAFELPYYYNNDEKLASYMVCAKRPNPGCVTFEVWEKLQSEDTYIYRDACLTFTPTGVLSAAYQSGFAVDQTGMTLVSNTDLNALGGASDSEIRGDGANMGIFETGEIFAWTSVVDNGDGTITLKGVWSGLLDTIPTAHASGERIWFYTYGASNPEDRVAPNALINVKNLPFGPRGSVELGAAAALNKGMDYRNLKPLAPAYLTINDLPNPKTTLGYAVASWRHRVRTQSILRQDDATASAPEGTYTVNVMVGGVAKRSFSTTDSTLKSGTPGIFNMSGAWMWNTNTIVATTCRMKRVDRIGQEQPARVFTVTPSGMENWCGSIGEIGLVNGTGPAARFQGVHTPIRDSAGNWYVLDNGCYIRRITTGGVVTLWMNLESYSKITVDPADGVTPRAVLIDDIIFSMTIDASDNIYFFAQRDRSIYKVTPSKVITKVAGNPYEDSGYQIDGTGSAASFSPECVLASDASGNLFVMSPLGGPSGWEGTLRYVTTEGVVTTIKERAGEVTGQMAVIDGELYCAGYYDRYTSGFWGIRKFTPTGVPSNFCVAMVVPGGTIRPDHVMKDPGGFLAYAGYGPMPGNPAFVKVNSSGISTLFYVDDGEVGYTPAQRVQDSSNGALPVEIQIYTTVIRTVAPTLLNSLTTSSGKFQMTGFGMCFGQIFGGQQ